MNILLVRTKAGIEYAEHIRNHIRACGVNCLISDIDSTKEVISRKGLTPGNTLIHSRTTGPNTNGKFAELESCGFTVINPPATLFLTSNKYRSQVHAKENGIPVAETHKVKKNDTRFVQKLLKKHKSVVLKPIYSQGQGIY